MYIPTGIIILKIIVLLAVFAPDAAVYYVARGGNDSNPGNDSLAPWRHCPGMAGWLGDRELEAGDTLYFRNDDVWDASSGLSMVQVKGGVTYDGRHWGEGERATFKAMAAFNRAVFNIMEDDQNHPTVIRGFIVDANDLVTSGITINWPHAERNLTGATKSIRDCEVKNVWSESALNQYEYGILMGGWGGYHIANIEVINCVVHDISRGGINNYMGNDIPDNRSDNVLIRANEIYATGKDPNYGGSGLAVKNHAVNTIVEFNYVHDVVNGTGIGLSVHPQQGFIGPSNLILRHNIVSGIPHCGMYIGSIGNKSFDIYGNIFMHCRYEGIRIAGRMSGTNRVRIYNNTFYQNFPADWSQQFRVEAHDAEYELFEVKNNIFYCRKGATSRAVLDDEGIIDDHANNLYFHPDRATLVICKDRRYTEENIASWEPTAVTVDPGFKDSSRLPDGFDGEYGKDLVPAPDGLSLLSGGAAKNGGADLGEAFAGAINMFGAATGIRRLPKSSWDIGAYESRDETGVRSVGRFIRAGRLNAGNSPVAPQTVYTVNGRVIRRNVRLDQAKATPFGNKHEPVQLNSAAQVIIAK